MRGVLCVCHVLKRSIMIKETMQFFTMRLSFNLSQKNGNCAHLTLFPGNGHARHIPYRCCTETRLLQSLLLCPLLSGCKSFSFRPKCSIPPNKVFLPCETPRLLRFVRMTQIPKARRGSPSFYPPLSFGNNRSPLLPIPFDVQSKISDTTQGEVFPTARSPYWKRHIRRLPFSAQTLRNTAAHSNIP